MEISNRSLLDRGSSEPLLEATVQRELGARVGPRTTRAAGIRLSYGLFSGRSRGCVLAHAFDFAALGEKPERTLTFQ